jgi:hypothetical protein
VLAGGESQRGNACVALASLLPSCSDDEWSEKDEFITGFTRLTGQTDSQLAELFTAVDKATSEFAPILKLPVPKKTLADYRADDAE